MSEPVVDIDAPGAERGADDGELSEEELAAVSGGVAVRWLIADGDAHRDE